MRQIPLTQGQFAIVDDEDYDYLNQWKWHAQFDEKTKGFYACRGYRDRNKKMKFVRMSRALLNLIDNKLHADHINHNTLDNQKKNLRVATHSESMTNRRSFTNSKSKFLGVSWHKTSGKWSAQIQKDKKHKWIGIFDTEIEAALAYNNFAKNLHGEFANLNLVPNG